MVDTRSLSGVTVAENSVFKTTDDLVSVWLNNNPNENTKVKIMKFLPAIGMGIFIVLIFIMYLKTQSFVELDALEQMVNISSHTQFIKFMLFLCSITLCVVIYGSDLRNDYILHKVSVWLREKSFDEEEYIKYLSANKIDIFKGVKYDKSIEAMYIAKNVAFRKVLVFKIIWYIVTIIAFEVISSTVLYEEYAKVFLLSGGDETEVNKLNILASVIGFVVIMAPCFIYEMVLSVKSAKWAEKFQPTL